MVDELPDDVADAPAAARFVYHVLEATDAADQHDLMAATGYPRRTVQRALDVLEERDLLERERDLTDARRVIYHAD